MRDTEYWIYVIELEPDQDPEARWYVGLSKHPEKRFHQHRAGQGAAWTRRNTILGAYPLGSLESKQDALMVEKYVSRFLMQEFGRKSTRGAGFRKPQKRPRTSLGHLLLPPGVGEALLDSGHPDLARAAAGNIGVEMHIRGPVRFSGTHAAREWADEHLPEGSRVRIDVPLWKNRYTGTAGQPATE